MNRASLKAKVTTALKKGIKASKSSISDLVPAEFTAGKIYEAYVLGLVCQNLKLKEGLVSTLVGASSLTLKSSPGPINSAYPHIEVTKQGRHVANIWTDVEFTALSAARQGKKSLTNGEFHEMDIAVVSPNCHPRPYPNEVYLVVECKNTGYQKSLLREILGVRRELSLLTDSQPSFFSAWPRQDVPAEPPSCIAVFSSDPSVSKYQAPGHFFGIDFFHEPL